MVASPRKDIFRQRTAVLTVFLLLALAVIIGRLFMLQVVHGDAARKQAEQQHSVYLKLMASRGEIDLVDKLTLLPIPVATNTKKYLVYAVPQAVQNPKLTSESLATALGLQATDILTKITDQTRKYVPLKKQLTEEEQAKITQLGLSGIFLDSEDSRYYPQDNLLSHVLGFVGYNAQNQKVGLYGLERYFDKDLAGKNGDLYEEKDISGAWIFGAQRQGEPAVDGVNLILTVDKNIQFHAQTVLAEAVSRHGADSGSIIVMDPKTGAILTMAAYPDFDPNNFGKVSESKIFSNQATIGVFEPGSTFKAITMAAAINENKLTPETTFVDTGQVKVDGYTIKNAEPGARGKQTMIEALDFSLNTGAIFAQTQIGNSEFLKYVKAFGFGQKTGIELPELSGDLSGILKGNITVNYYTASFGQGISVTPIQMLQSYGALANGGKMMKPYIVQTKIFPDGKVVNTDPVVVGQPVSSKTAYQTSAMLVDVVEKGFGKRAAVPGYYIAGKTGTAQVPRTDGKPGYDEHNNIGSFIGYGPVDDPQFVMLIRIDHPRDVQYAESTAGPVFGQMAQFILNYLHIPPTRK